jgi:SAM-dependent methyltransferase
MAPARHMSLSASQSGGAVYAALAPYYDAYTDHPAFRHWITGLEELARRYGVHGNRLLDAGCGTGKSLLPLLERGYEITGVDGSEEMLALAAGKVGDRVQLVHADLTDLPVLGEFDLITCLNDVSNCILDPADLGRAYERLAANLAPGGVLVFDASLVSIYRTAFATTHVRDRGDHYFVWRGEGTEDFEEGDVTAATHEVFVRQEGDVWRRMACRHVQRHHPHALLVELLDAAGLEIVALLGDDDGVRDGSPPDPERHLKAIYVTRRRAGSSD